MSMHKLSVQLHRKHDSTNTTLPLQSLDKQSSEPNAAVFASDLITRHCAWPGFRFWNVAIMGVIYSGSGKQDVMLVW